MGHERGVGRAGGSQRGGAGPAAGNAGEGFGRLSRALWCMSGCPSIHASSNSSRGGRRQDPRSRYLGIPGHRTISGEGKIGCPSSRAPSGHGAAASPTVLRDEISGVLGWRWGFAPAQYLLFAVTARSGGTRVDGREMGVSIRGYIRRTDEGVYFWGFGGFTVGTWSFVLARDV